MTDDRISNVKKMAGVYGCVECGRCVAVCPMAEMYVNFSIAMSPRGVIKKAITGENLIRDKNIWYCTECNAGTDACPQGVSCRDLIHGLREIAMKHEAAEDMKYCKGCGEPFVAIPVEDFVFTRLQAEPSNVLRILELCPVCRRERYMERNA
ncbi:MAG: 4Fe-4S dicluster domain-containing protein [Deltaproteobacteria bacterium]|nr:4Fe-4S dicluster domain-containing protein [Deltaproteobacteria bacterium]